MNIATAHLHSAPAIDLAHEESFSIGDCLVEPALRRISCSPQREKVLEPKVMQVLIALSRKPETILSHDDLIEHCWDYATVGDGSVNRVISLLRKALQEVAGDRIRIETLPKVGYRLRVSEEAGILSFPPRDAATSSPIRLERFSVPWLLVILVCLTVILIAAVSIRPSTGLNQSIAIMPTQWEGPAEPFLAEGLDAELRDQLVRSDGLTLSGVESTRALARLRLSPGDVGKRLGADFVVTSRLRRDGNAVKLTSRLFPAGSSDVEWEEELFSTNDALISLPVRTAREILLALGRDPTSPSEGEIKDELDRRTYLIAHGMVHSRDRDQVASALDLLEPLSERVPNSAKVLALTAKAKHFSRQASWKSALETPDEAAAYAQKALRLNPKSVEALKMAGLLDKDSASRLRMLEKAVRLAPSDAEAWLWLSNERAALPNAGPALDAARETVLLDPLWNRSWQAPGAWAEYGLMHHADTLDRLIITASGAGWPAELARVRMLKRKGELSTAWRKLQAIAPAAREGAPAIFAQQYNLLASLLDLPPLKKGSQSPRTRLAAIELNRIPELGELRALGFAGADFWKLGPLLPHANVLMVREGRSRELIEYYDAGSASALIAVHREWITPPDRALLAIYLGHALHTEGRYEQADKLMRTAQQILDRRLSAQGPRSVADLMAAAALASAKGDGKRAVIFLRRARSQGWPYTATSTVHVDIEALTQDPVFKSAMNVPGFVQIIADVRSEIEHHKANLPKQRDGVVPI